MRRRDKSASPQYAKPKPLADRHHSAAQDDQEILPCRQDDRRLSYKGRKEQGRLRRPCSFHYLALRHVILNEVKDPVTKDLYVILNEVKDPEVKDPVTKDLYVILNVAKDLYPHHDDFTAN